MPVHLVNHPLVQDALTELRDVRTQPPEFRRAVAHLLGLPMPGIPDPGEQGIAIAEFAHR